MVVSCQVKFHILAKVRLIGDYQPVVHNKSESVALLSRAKAKKISIISF